MLILVNLEWFSLKDEQSERHYIILSTFLTSDISVFQSQIDMFFFNKKSVVLTVIILFIISFKCLQWKVRLLNLGNLCSRYFFSRKNMEKKHGFSTPSIYVDP